MMSIFWGSVRILFSSLSRKDGVRCFSLLGEGSVTIARAIDWSVAIQKPLFWEISILQDLLMQVQACSLTLVEKPH